MAEHDGKLFCKTCHKQKFANFDMVKPTGTGGVLRQRNFVSVSEDVCVLLVVCVRACVCVWCECRLTQPVGPYASSVYTTC